MLEKEAAIRRLSELHTAKEERRWLAWKFVSETRLVSQRISHQAVATVGRLLEPLGAFAYFRVLHSVIGSTLVKSEEKLTEGPVLI